jgi:hypothetical protein
MSQNWFVTKSGQAEKGPYTSPQLKHLADSDQIGPEDTVRREDMQAGTPAGKIKGLFSAPPAAPAAAAALPAAAAPPAAATAPAAAPSAAVPRPVARPVTPPPPPAPEPLPLDDDPPIAEALPLDDAEETPKPKEPEQAGGWRSRLSGLGSSLASSTKGAVGKLKDTVATAAANAAANAKAAAANAKAAVSSSSAAAPAVSAPPAEMPPLRPRPGASQHRDTGELVPPEFGTLWNDLEKAELKGEDLLFFCPTKTRHEGSIGSQVLSFFSKPSTKPIYHLAVFREVVVLLHCSPENVPTVSVRFPIEGLNWKFEALSETSSGIASLFKKPTPEEQAERARTLNLTITAGDAEQLVQLYQGPAAEELKQLLVKLVLARVEARIAETRYHQAESMLDRFPPESDVAPAAAALREKIGTVATAAVDYQGGHPEIAGPVRGNLRFDALGAEFFLEETGDSVRLPYSRILKIYEPRAGKFPAEYVRSVELSRKAAMAAIASAKLARRSDNMALRLGAEASLIAAKAKLASAKLGPPFQNRIVLIVRSLDGERLKLVFDLSGSSRQSVQEAAAAFYTKVATIEDRFAVAPEQPDPVEEEPAEPPQRKKIVGCPKCQARLRAAQPGVIQCPRCQAKVRVQESQFAI